MMDVAGGGRLLAAGEPAVAVSGCDGAAQVGGDGVGRGADVQWQADGAGQAGVLAGAQPAGEPVGAG